MFLVNKFGLKKYTCGSGYPTDPNFFCRPYNFFDMIHRATLFSLGGCGLYDASTVLRVLCPIFVAKTRKRNNKLPKIHPYTVGNMYLRLLMFIQDRQNHKKLF